MASRLKDRYNDEIRYALVEKYDDSSHAGAEAGSR